MTYLVESYIITLLINHDQKFAFVYKQMQKTCNP